MDVITSTTSDVSVVDRSYERSDTENSSQKRGRRRKMPAAIGQSILTIVPPLVLAVLIGISWYIANWRLNSTLGSASALLLPAPGDVFSSLLDGLSSGLFLSNALVTIQESIGGFLIALVIALPLGYGLAKSRLFAAAFQPYIAAAQAIPAIVIAPILVLWLGYDATPIMLLCMLIVLFPMVITTVFGLQTIERDLVDAARVEGSSGWQMLKNVEFPLALPAILAGVRTGLTLSITGAVVGEFVSGGGGSPGLGSLVLTLQHQFETPLMFATLFILAALASLYYGASWLLIKAAQTIY